MQVKDDIELLHLMLKDNRSAPDFYKPTNYWLNYEKIFVPELLKLGLQDFRRRNQSALDNFGAIDNGAYPRIDLKKNRILYNRFSWRIPLWSRGLEFLSKLLTKISPITMSYYMSVDDIRELAFLYVKSKGEKAKAKPIQEIESSLYGNPEDVFEIAGKKYTMSFLRYYAYYAYCCHFIDFERIKVFVELGSGSGKQIEVLKKLHPHMSFFLFDIPPQLYVCEQYLKSVFPDDVISYRTTRDMEVIPTTFLPGKIYIFGNRKFSLIKDLSIDLFWNAASFQEMEPDVVANYLQFVNKNAKAVFLSQAMSGKERARKKGDHGVLNQTVLKDYKAGLKDFDLMDITDKYCSLPNIISKSSYSSSFWKAKS